MTIAAAFLRAAIGLSRTLREGLSGGVHDHHDKELAFRPKVEGLMLDPIERNKDIVTRYIDDPEFRAIVDQEFARRTHDEIRGGEPRLTVN